MHLHHLCLQYTIYLIISYNFWNSAWKQVRCRVYPTRGPNCKVWFSSHFLCYLNELACLWCVLCLHQTEHRHTCASIRERPCCVSAAFLGPSSSLNGVINRVPWVPASPPKQPSLMNHSYSEVQVTQIEGLPDRLTPTNTSTTSCEHTHAHTE